MSKTSVAACRSLLLAVLVATALAAALAGCGGSTNGETGATTATGGSSATSSGATDATKSNSARDAGSSSTADSETGSDSDESNGSGDSAEKGSGSGFQQEPPPVQLFTDNESSIDVRKPTAFVAQGQGQLNTLKRRQVAGTGNDQPAVTVNFREARQAIVVVLPASPKGTQITIAGVSSDGNTTRVRALVLTSPKNCKSRGPNPARPTAWVETRKLPRRTKVVVERQSSSC